MSNLRNLTDDEMFEYQGVEDFNTALIYSDEILDVVVEPTVVGVYSFQDTNEYSARFWFNQDDDSCTTWKETELGKISKDYKDFAERLIKIHLEKTLMPEKLIALGFEVSTITA
jgi:hypothetical protein